ncbi:MAG: hypothetical protein ABIS20_03025 [Thermoanaerobaculia bacterium]
MSWDTKDGYPMTALRTVTVKATDWQRACWEAEGKRLGVSRGAFMAWAADMAIGFREAYNKVTEEHDREMHPEKYKAL